MQVTPNVIVNFPGSHTFSQQTRKSQFATKSNLIIPNEPSPLTYTPKFELIIKKAPEVLISNAQIKDVMFKNKVGPCDYTPKNNEV